jgi:hypothetical protein
LRQRLVAEGRAQWLDKLKPFVAGAGATPANQEEVAARLGVPIATLHTWLWRLRQRYRDLLRTEVANTVSGSGGRGRRIALSSSNIDDVI